MPCLLVLITLAAPRLAIALLWFFTGWFHGIFPTILWPLLGWGVVGTLRPRSRGRGGAA